MDNPVCGLEETVIWCYRTVVSHLFKHKMRSVLIWLQVRAKGALNMDMYGLRLSWAMSPWLGMLYRNL